MNRALGLVTLLFALGCGSDPAPIGSACSTASSFDECVTGAVCTNGPDNSFTCRKICVGQEDCNQATENCNGISGSSTKSCQPK
jgi:hypothetical protein